jgi:tRNA(Ile)-lysidine synthase
MAPVSERAGVRLLRPLLAVPRGRLAATLRGWGQDWIDDPSNENIAHTRVRLRRLLPSLAGAGMSPAELSGTAAGLARERAAMDEVVAALLASAAEPDPAGYLWLDPAALPGAPAEVGQRALARCLMTIGGNSYPPRSERLIRLHRQIAGGKLGQGATLAGCQIQARDGRLLIFRELAAVEQAVSIESGVECAWDRRFSVILAKKPGKTGRFLVSALGVEGYRRVLAVRPDLRTSPIPAAARPVLPALWRAGRRGQGPLAVPHLDYRARNSQLSVAIDFVPTQALASARFTVA